MVGDVVAVEASEYAIMRTNRTYFSMFQHLEALGFQRESMRSFFAAFNEADPIDRQTFVTQLVESLRQPVSRSAGEGTMGALISRIEGIIRVFTTEEIGDPSIVYAIQSNLYLYLAALYTHLGQGQQIKRVDERFTAALQKMPKGEARLELQLKYMNHRVVTLTDWFQYAEAEDIFLNKMAPHWEMQAELARELFADESFGAEEYGREIGSYLILLKHRLRVSDTAYRAAHSEAIAKWYETALAQATRPEDLGRCYLNICGVETELGHYDNALRYLGHAVAAYYSVEPQVYPNDLEQICRLTDCVNSTDDHETAQPWVFYQYIRLASDMATSDIAASRLMYEALGKNALTGATFNWIKNDFLRSTLKWRAACLLIDLGVQRDIALVYLKSAADDMSVGNSTPLSAISIAIRARLIAFLIASDRLKDALAESKALYNTYNSFRKLSVAANANNPFISQNDVQKLEGYLPPCYIDAQDIETVTLAFQKACNEKEKQKKQRALENAFSNYMTISRIIAY